MQSNLILPKTIIKQNEKQKSSGANALFSLQAVIRFHDSLKNAYSKFCGTCEAVELYNRYARTTCSFCFLTNCREADGNCKRRSVNIDIEVKVRARNILLLSEDEDSVAMMLILIMILPAIVGLKKMVKFQCESRFDDYPQNFILKYVL